MKHIAVVPVADIDQPAERALKYAGTLAPQVLAVHVRAATGHRTGEFEELWARCAPTVPLVVVDGAINDWQGPLLQMLGALRRTAQADLITVVMPPRPPAAQRPPRPAATPIAALRLALLRQGIVVRAVPTGESAPD